MKPLIGILGRLATIDSGAFNGLERINLTNAYINAIEKAGGVPIVIPANTNLIFELEMFEKQPVTKQ